MAESTLKAGEILLHINERGCLSPVDGESADRFLKLKRDEIYKFSFKRVRNYQFHKKYFSLLNMVFNNQDTFDNFEWFRKHTLIAIGWCDTFVHPKTGEVLNTPKSISFEKCKESEFRQLYTDTVGFLCKEYGFSEALISQIIEY